MSSGKTRRSKVVSYNKWGYIFLVPFIVVYLLFQLYPLVNTIYYSFFEYFRVNLNYTGPTWIGIENYKWVFEQKTLMTCIGNTMILWIIGFIPQILVSLLLGAWFSDNRLKLKFEGFFKTVIYLPNLIMASSFAALFATLFAGSGPVNQILESLNIIKEPIDFRNSVGWTRSIIGFLNFIMWFGNTTILLLAGMLGIDQSLFEAAEVDGATSNQKFFKITLPLLRPILVYVMITSLIGGLQMFDIPQLYSGAYGGPGFKARTAIMFLNSNLRPSRNYGRGGAISVVLFVITGILSVIVFRFSDNKTKVK